MPISCSTYLKNLFSHEKMSVIFIWISFLLLSLFVTYHHEPWADEAQAWLIARDSDVWEILSQFARCEGQPPLWHLLLHGLILCGLPYSAFYLVPWVISSAGVGLFLWKSPFPKWINMLIPFTYFIFFQYTIIARQYCFSLLFISWLAIIYPKRHERPFLYAFALCLFGFSSMPGLLIAGSLYFLFLCECFLLSEKQKQNWLASGIIFIFMLSMVAVLFPDLDNPFLKVKTVMPLSEKLFANLPVVISIPFFNSGWDFTVLFICCFFWNNKKNLLYVLILYGPLLLFFSLIVFQVWLLGYLFLVFIFSLWIFYHEPYFQNLKTNIRFWLLLYLFILHICCSYYSSLYDISFPYSSAKEVAEFIEPYHKSGKNIIATGFHSVSIQPYFSENIFTNFERGFWIYRSSAKQYRLLETLNEHGFPDVIIFFPNHVGSLGAVEEPYFLEKCSESGLYELAKSFPARIISKNFAEDQSIAVYVKKGK